MTTELKEMDKYTNISTIDIWINRLPSESELKVLVLKNDPILYILNQYIEHSYWKDIYTCFRRCMFTVHRYIKFFKVNSNLQPAVIIDLDETFLQNASFAPNITRLWKTNSSFYNKLAKKDIGAILPYMIIFYEYIRSKGIKPIFLTGRNKTIRTLTKHNLKIFGVYDKDYLLYMNPGINSKQFKNKIYNTLLSLYDIVCVLNDQDEINTVNLIKFPQLYNINV